MTKTDRGPAQRVANAFDSMEVGQGTAIVSGRSINGGTRVPCMEVMVQVTGATAAFVGNSRRQFFRLAQYDSIKVPINDVSEVFIRTDGGTTAFNWFAMT